MNMLQDPVYFLTHVPDVFVEEYDRKPAEAKIVFF